MGNSSSKKDSEKAYSRRSYSRVDNNYSRDPYYSSVPRSTGYSRNSAQDDNVEVNCMDMSEDQFQQVLNIVVKCLGNRRSSVGSRASSAASNFDITKDIKKALDIELGPAWSVAMGSFGMFVTYEQSQFAHFYVGPTEFVVFKAFAAEEATSAPSQYSDYNRDSGYNNRDYNRDTVNYNRDSDYLTPTGSRASPRQNTSQPRNTSYTYAKVK